MAQGQSPVRPIPLKIAGVIGLATLVLYIGLSIESDASVALLIFFGFLIAVASALAWFADEFEGRSAALVAAGIFFVLGILSAPVIAGVYLAAVVLCFVGFTKFGGDDDPTPS